MRAVLDEVRKELKDIMNSIAKKYTKFKFDHTDKYFFIILPCNGEFTEDTSSSPNAGGSKSG
jgi:hypothetical protein